VPVAGAVLVRTALDRAAGAHHVVAVSRSSEPRATRPSVHVVKLQETVALIARRYGVSVADIVRWNDLDDTARIRPGDRLRVATLGGREEAQGGFR